MKLVASLTSPFARKARILLLEKQLPFELIVDIPWNEETQVPLHNPLGKVPVLITGEGESLYDSRVIAAYLDTQPGKTFIPTEARQRVQVLHMEALADGIADAAAAIFIERRRPEAQISQAWIDRQMQKIERGLQALEQRVTGRIHIVGGDFSLADVAVICALGYLDLRFPEVGWRGRFPGLAAFAAVHAERPAVRDTLPPA